MNVIWVQTWNDIKDDKAYVPVVSSMISSEIHQNLNEQVVLWLDFIHSLLVIE